MNTQHLIKLFGCSALFAMSAAVSIAASAAPNAIQNTLIEERQWAGLETKRIKVGDIDWAYSEGGPKTAPTVLLLHGLAGSRDNWNRVAVKLTKQYHVIIPDVPGQGDTIAPADYDYQVAGQVEAVRRFVEAIDLTKNLNIAGHSLGGSIATIYTGLYFQDTQSLLLVDPGGVYKNNHSIYQQDSKNLYNLLVTKPGDFSRLLKATMASPPFIPKYIANEQEALMIAKQDTTKKVVDRQIELLPNYQPESLGLILKAIEAPTLVMWGEKDQLFDVASANEVVGYLKRPEPAFILQDVGHVPILEADQLVAQRYLEFLKKVIAIKNPFAPAS